MVTGRCSGTCFLINSRCSENINGPDRVAKFVGNETLLFWKREAVFYPLRRLFGAEVRILPDLEDITPLLDSITSELTQQGRRPYIIPLGGSNGLGAAAYAAALLELLDQFERLEETLNAIVVPTVSGGTLAGLLLGAALSGWRGRIIGISAGDKTERAIRRVRAHQLAAAEILGVPGKIIGQTPIVIDDRFVGEDYGIRLSIAGDTWHLQLPAVCKNEEPHTSNLDPITDRTVLGKGAHDCSGWNSQMTVLIAIPGHLANYRRIDMRALDSVDEGARDEHRWREPIFRPPSLCRRRRSRGGRRGHLRVERNQSWKDHGAP